MAFIPYHKQIIYFFSAFFISLLITPIVIYISRRTNLISKPRPERWHKKPTALFGGVAIFTGFIASLLPLLNSDSTELLLLAIGAFLFFVIGFLDDVMEFSPQGKFLAQLIVVVGLVGMGLKINLPGYPVLSICLSAFWLVAMSNALNILDNMDGLSSGITIVASISLAAYGNIFDINGIVVPSLALAGACAGFFLYNFKPAKIFMGDCGSLFLGFVLGALSILSTHFSEEMTLAGSMYGGISNMILMLVIPVAMLIVPIFDTALVSVNRLQAGRSIAQGGKDHTSHRLVRLGLSEERAVVTLMLLSATVSFVTLYMAIHSMYGLLAVLSLTAIFFVFVGIYLSYTNKDIYPSSGFNQKRSVITSAMSKILNKKQILQVCVDLILLTIAYYSAYLLKFDGHINKINKILIVQSLPLVLAVKLGWMWILGLYRGQWRFASLDDTFKIIKAVIFSSLTIIAILVFLNRFSGYSRIVFFLDAVMTFLLIGGVRFILRMLNEYFIRQAEKKHSIPVLIFGAGDGGDLFLRELRKRKGHDYLPVGFIDDDIAKQGQEIHGVKVLGTRKEVRSIIRRLGVKILFISILSAPNSAFHDLVQVCKDLGVKCVRIRPLVSFEELNAKFETRAKVVPFKKGRRKK